MKTIVLIDDDQIFNFISSEMIHEADPSIEIKAFLSSREGLEYLKQIVVEGNKLPDILFLDIRMPELTGFDVLEQLQMAAPEEQLKSMKIYMLTSSLDETDNQKAESSPLVTGFLGKPLDIEELQQILN